MTGGDDAVVVLPNEDNDGSDGGINWTVVGGDEDDDDRGNVDGTSVDLLSSVTLPPPTPGGAEYKESFFAAIGFVPPKGEYDFFIVEGSGGEVDVVVVVVVEPPNTSK